MKEYVFYLHFKEKSGFIGLVDLEESGEASHYNLFNCNFIFDEKL